MNERDFDKLFSDKLNEEGDFPHKDKVKAKVFTQLDHTVGGGVIPDGGIAANPFWKWLLPLLALLLVWNGYQFFEMKHIKEENLALKTAVEAIKTDKITLKKDSIVYQTNTIYQRDTIYKTVYIVKNIEEKTLTNNAQIDKNKATETVVEPQNIENKKTQNSSKETDNQLVTNDEIRNNSTIEPQIETQKTNTENKENSILTTNTELPQVNLVEQNPSNNIPAKMDSIAQINKENQLVQTNIEDPKEILNTELTAPKSEENLAENTQETKESKVYVPKMKVKMGAIGLQGGTSLETRSSPDLHKNVVLGLSAELKLTDKLSIVASSDLYAIAHKSFDKREVHDIDTLSFPPEFRFEHIESERKAVSFGLGLNYQLSDKWRVRPFVSLSYFYQYLPEYNLKYELRHPQTKEENEFVKETPSQSKQLGFIGLGADFPIKGAFYARLRADYSIELNRPANVPEHNALLLRAGVFYKF